MIRTRVASALVILAAVASAVSATGAAGASAVSRNAYIGTFNIRGNLGHDGQGGEWITTEVNRIKRVSPTWFSISLQEVCRGQAIQFAAELGMTARFATTGPICRNGEPYGNAILVRATATGDPNPDSADKLVINFPDWPGLESRNMVCVRTNEPGGAVACSVHLTQGSTVAQRANRRRQIMAIFNCELHFTAEGCSSGYGGQPLFTRGMVVLGGDFNATPTSAHMDPMYGPPTPPEYFGLGAEADSTNGSRTGQATTDSAGKIDYLWVWDMRGGPYWQRLTTTVVGTSSDHHFYSSMLVW